MNVRFMLGNIALNNLRRKFVESPRELHHKLLNVWKSSEISYDNIKDCALLV